MKLLRSHDLPKKLTAFRSLTSDLKAALDCRTAMLARAKGYPRPAHVVARIQALIPLDGGLLEIKNGIQKLRDIAQYAAEILMTIPQLKVEKQLLKTADVQDYINNNKEDYGYGHLDANDVLLATYLILSSEMVEASWTLDMPMNNTTNRVAQFHKLYQNLSTPRITSTRFAPGTTPEMKVADRVELTYAGEPPYLYRSDSNKVEPIMQIDAITRALGEVANRARQGGNYNNEIELNTVSRALQREDTILRLCDLRLIDHLLCLFMSPDIWNAFVPHRPRSDAGNNEERAKGLKLFAGYLHSLLMMPYFFRTELWKQGYERMEKWIGNLPFVPQDILDNYKNIVSNYDTLGISAEVTRLFDLNQSLGDKPTGSDIHVFFEEFAHLFDIDNAKKRATDAVANNPQIKITELSMLKDSKYNYILLSHPLGKYEMIRDIQKVILDTSMYRTILNEAFSAIIPGITKYLQVETVEKLRTASFKVPFDFHQSLPVTPSYAAASGTRIDGDVLSHRYYAMSYNYDAERTLVKDMLYTVTNARHIVETFAPVTVFDRPVARELRSWVGREWRSLYPSSLLMGDRVIEPASYKQVGADKNSNIELEQLMEYITGYHFEMVKTSLSSVYAREIWSTMFSSFGILYSIDRTAPVTGTTTELTAKVDGAGFPLRLVEGMGMPYGKSYDALARLQKFEDSDIIKLTDEIYIAFLKRVPVPTHSLNIGKMNLNRPYYYCPGNGSTVEVKRFVFDDSLLHFAMRPISDIGTMEAVLFDSIYAYLNDSLLLQEDIAMKVVNDTTGEYGFALPFKDEDWKLDRLVPMIEYASLPKYASVSGGVAITEQRKEESVTKLVKEMETQIKKADEASVVRTEAETSSTLDAGLPVSKSVGGSKKKKEPREGSAEEQNA